MEKQLTHIKHKPLSLRGREFRGTVTSDKMMDSVTIEWPRRRYVAKYQRYEKRRSKVKAHNPKEIDAKEGDLVRIQETKPISKTKSFVVVEVITRAADDSNEQAPKKVAKKAAKKAVKKASKKE